MAVTQKGQRIIMTAAADAVPGKMKIQLISLSHSAAASYVLDDTAGVEIARGDTAVQSASPKLMFPCGLIVDGLVVDTLTAGTLTVYLAP